MKNLRTKLSYTLYFVLVAFLMVGCTEIITEKEQAKRMEQKFKIIEVEGCEYLYRAEYRIGYLAHKGNCKNH